MPEPFIKSHTPIHHPCCWELTNQPARIKLPQTLSSLAGSFIQFDRKIHQNPDSINCIRNYLGINGVEEATADYEIPRKQLFGPSRN